MQFLCLMPTKQAKQIELIDCALKALFDECMDVLDSSQTLTNPAVESMQAPTVDAELWFQTQVSTYTAQAIGSPTRFQDSGNPADC